MGSPSFHHRVLFLLLAAAACECGNEPPPDDTFDGNVIVGDAAPRDMGTPPDVGADAAEDAEAGPPDVPMPDVGEDGGADAGEMDAGSLCDELPTAVLSVSEAIAQAGALDGMVVEVTGTATNTPYMCTMRPCTAENPCCNTCTASVTLEGLLPLTRTICFVPGCEGTECAQTCRPAILGVPQRFVGRLVDGPPTLELISVSD